jgi:tetraacyldisaccharide 4'-kinase
VRSSLFFLELFYQAGFFLVTRFKRYRGNKSVPFKVISVGNLSVGGTGKSVFVQFLSKKLDRPSAILLRGYKRKNKKNILIDIDNKNKYRPSDVGDEALMFSQKLDSPIVVGKSRIKSVELLKKYCENKNKKIKFLLLDDGYQNFQLKKDCEILLLDARAPFDNNHCLPAGRLREKDFSRADIIILLMLMRCMKKSCAK